MYKFFAVRIHDGYLTIDQVPEKLKEKVRQAYKELYGEEI